MHKIKITTLELAQSVIRIGIVNPAIVAVDTSDGLFVYVSKEIIVKIKSRTTFFTGSIKIESRQN
ncbi:hypothetical protein SDC9_137613 [bioreactor metagenome]|uniref:Uncharacterized protein n=1 Tax=bioreactor metagenome TaxID=1076179 RepID=A0A645DPT8_9ZZZZ